MTEKRKLLGAFVAGFLLALAVQFALGSHGHVEAALGSSIGRYAVVPRMDSSGAFVLDTTTGRLNIVTASGSVNSVAFRDTDGRTPYSSGSANR